MNITNDQAAAILPAVQRAANAITALWDALREVEQELGQDFSNMSVDAFDLADNQAMSVEEAKDWVESLTEDGPPHEGTTRHTHDDDEDA